MTDFPAAFSNHFAKDVPPVCDAEHGVSELGVAENLRVTEGVLVRHEHFEFILLHLTLHDILRNRDFVN